MARLAFTLLDQEDIAREGVDWGLWRALFHVWDRLPPVDRALLRTYWRDVPAAAAPTIAAVEGLALGAEPALGAIVDGWRILIDHRVAARAEPAVTYGLIGHEVGHAVLLARQIDSDNEEAIELLADLHAARWGVPWTREFAELATRIALGESDVISRTNVQGVLC